MGSLTRTRDKNYWESKNLILASGEVGFEDGTGKFKVGNGHTRWNDLAYSSRPTYSFTEEETSEVKPDVSSDIVEARDTDVEREQFIPARLSDATLRAVLIPRPLGGADGDLLGRGSDGDIVWVDTVTVTKGDIGLGNVDNTSDQDKPVSTAMATLLAAKASARPVPPTGRFFHTFSAAAASTSAACGIGTLRAAPWIVDKSLTIDRIGAEVTTIGDVGSKVRLGIYADNGKGHPGALVLDAGQIAGDSATGQSLNVSQVLAPGIYWVAAVVQAVTTTQPTLRISANWTPPIPLDVGQSNPSNGLSVIGHQMTGVTGALPSNFDTAISTHIFAPRVWVRVS